MEEVPGPDYKVVPTDYARDAIIRSRYYLCCLVSSYWNKIFTPSLYREIVIHQKALPLLLHTLWHARPEHRTLIRRMRIIVGQSGPTAGVGMTPVLPPVPNLVRLSIDSLDFEQCSPSLPRILSLLPNSCRTDICGQTIGPGSLPKLIRFLRRAKSHYFACDINSNL